MTEGITYVGLDAHKASISVAMLLPGQRQPIEWAIANEPGAIRRLGRKLGRESPGEVRCCYEAGPCGYALQRRLLADDVVCEVVAPSLIPVKPGDHIKTDRRDAKKLAELFRAGLLTEVRPPTEEEESARDLCRCREDAIEDRARCRHRLLKMLLRRGLAFPGKRPWGRAHAEWLRSVRFEYAGEQAVFEDYQLAILQVDERIRTLDEQLTKLASEEPYCVPVGWLRCFHGIETITAMTLVTELHGVERFHSPRQMMAYLGLVPSENSSSDKTRRGGITKAGNSHVRRVLVESAWHYRHAAGVGKVLLQRRRGQPVRAIAIANTAQQRLCRRFRRLTERGKPSAKVVVAVARELAGFVWSALYEQALSN
ncbi:MAG: IS110 family transposase [Acidobacteriaceae bacterium]